MEILECVKRVEGGKIVIDVPSRFDGKNLKIVVTEDEDFDIDDKIKKFHEMSSEERLKHLQRFAGTAKYPDFPIDKYDVYDQ